MDGTLPEFRPKTQLEVVHFTATSVIVHDPVVRWPRSGTLSASSDGALLPGRKTEAAKAGKHNLVCRITAFPRRDRNDWSSRAAECRTRDKEIGAAPRYSTSANWLTTHGAQVSKPAVSPISKSAGRSDGGRRSSFESLRVGKKEGFLDGIVHSRCGLHFVWPGFRP